MKNLILVLVERYPVVWDMQICYNIVYNGVPVSNNVLFTLQTQEIWDKIEPNKRKFFAVGSDTSCLR